VRVTVHWYGPLRDRRGCASEEVETGAPTLDALWDELMRIHALPPRRELALAVAVDDELATWNTAPSAGDTIAFLPPVAGG
jgi:molybdopterin synthase sulfur carrier subunit